MNGYVYAGKIDEEKLKHLIENVFSEKTDVFHILYSLEKITVNEGIPQKIEEKGYVFNSEVEVKWSKNGETFSLLILSDNEKSDYLKFGLSKVEGDWKTESYETYLQDLNAPNVNPTFKVYPKINSGKGKLIIKLFKHNEEPFLQSFRGFKNDEK